MREGYFNLSEHDYRPTFLILSSLFRITYKTTINVSLIRAFIRINIQTNVEAISIQMELPCREKLVGWLV